MLGLTLAWLTGWLIFLRFYVSLKNFSLIWRRHRWRWRAAKARPVLSTQNLWAGRDLFVPHLLLYGASIYRSYPNDHPFQLPLTICMGCRGPILTLILTGFLVRKEEKIPQSLLWNYCLHVKECLFLFKSMFIYIFTDDSYRVYAYPTRIAYLRRHLHMFFKQYFTGAF
jgi:hypothetical protein